jgi:hypothetical protein
MGILVGSIVMALVPAYFVLQVLMLIRYSGAWRLASALPLLLLVPATAFSLVALQAGSNLWPLAIIFSAPLGGIMLVVTGALHHYRSGWFV